MFFLRRIKQCKAILRLIDDPHHIKSSDGTGILGGLALSIIEIGRDSDHSMCNLQVKEKTKHHEGRFQVA